MFEIGKFEDYKKAIADCDHFKVYEKDDYFVINYHLSDNTTFPDPNESGISTEERRNRILRRDCRGIIFDKEGKLIRLPYHKFFNLNEKEETNIKNVDFSKPHIILEKLDGSMVTPLTIAGNLRLATKAGITDTSMEAEVFIASRPQYDKFMQWSYEWYCLPIFEWCSRKNRIVVDYPVDNLILTAMRAENGKYIEYAEMKKIADSFGIPVVRCVYDGSKPVDRFIEEDIKNQEIMISNPMIIQEKAVKLIL
jgi:RNA ligase